MKVGPSYGRLTSTTLLTISVIYRLARRRRRRTLLRRADAATFPTLNTSSRTALPSTSASTHPARRSPTPPRGWRYHHTTGCSTPSTTTSSSCSSTETAAHRSPSSSRSTSTTPKQQPSCPLYQPRASQHWTPPSATIYSYLQAVSSSRRTRTAAPTIRTPSRLHPAQRAPVGLGDVTSRWQKTMIVNRLFFFLNRSRKRMQHVGFENLAPVCHSPFQERVCNTWIHWIDASRCNSVITHYDISVFSPVLNEVLNMST